MSEVEQEYTFHQEVLSVLLCVLHLIKKYSSDLTELLLMLLAPMLVSE